MKYKYKRDEKYSYVYIQHDHPENRKLPKFINAIFHCKKLFIMTPRREDNDAKYIHRRKPCVGWQKPVGLPEMVEMNCVISWFM